MTSRLKTFSSKTFSLCWSWKWKSEKQKKITQNIIDTNIYFSILTPDTWKTFQNLFNIKFKKETCTEQNQLPISIVDKKVLRCKTKSEDNERNRDHVSCKSTYVNVDKHAMICFMQLLMFYGFQINFEWYLGNTTKL